MKETLKPGLSCEARFMVDESRSIDFLGPEARVYATPCIVHDLEYACLNLILEHLDEGQASVGARVEVEHAKPTPMGMEVVHKIRVESVDGRSVTLAIEVFDALEKVATARHTRIIVATERLKRAIQQKREQMSGSGRQTNA